MAAKINELTKAAMQTGEKNLSCKAINRRISIFAAR